MRQQRAGTKVRRAVSSTHGHVALMVEVRTDMQPGHLRVPHGWWFPELLGSDARGADRLVTRVVETQVPDTSGVRPTHQTRLDRPVGVDTSDAVADQLTQEHRVPEPTVAASTTVDAPPEQVYALVSDLPRMGEWSPENTGGRWIGRRPAATVGARFVGTNRGARRWWPTTTVVTTAEHGRHFAFDTRLGPLTAARWSYDLAPTPDGGCTVTESWYDRRPGWLVVVGKHLTGVDDRIAHTRAMLDSTLAGIRKAAETS